jgi:predicted nucleotidyltransferase
MIDIDAFVKAFTEKTDCTFKNRAVFIGLQGSYGRGEAAETSDIDVVLILDTLCISDLDTYKNMLDTLPYRNLICGFISGKDELTNWEESELFQFLHDTTPIKGNLDFIFEKIDGKAVSRAIKIGACNIYHTCAHNYVHEQSTEILRALFKSARFVLQAILFSETGEYLKSKNELLSRSAKATEILQAERKFSDGEIDFNRASAILFDFAQKILRHN